MKLRTEVVGGKVRPSMHNGYDVEHDLLAAHALLQAMEEVNVHEYVFVANALIEVHRRADEILAGWLVEE